MRPRRRVSFLFSLALFVSAAGAMTPEEEIAAQAPAALAIIDGWQAKDPERAQRAVHVVLWTPTDREPAPRYRARLSAIFEETTAFYAREMARNGFGARTIRTVKEADGLGKIHLVRGAEPYANYDGSSGSRIRRECVPVLRAAGLDPEKETIVIFCNLANWDADKRSMSQNSPYYASGTNRSGTAWQVDSPLLDLALLETREPLLQDGQYGRISPGRYRIGAAKARALFSRWPRRCGSRRIRFFCGSVKGFDVKAGATLLDEFKLHSLPA
jgi:hypothetical protein